MPPRIFVGGVPACGKTFFSNWLGREHGYVVIHSDSDGDRELEQQAMCAPRLAIEYGFNPETALQLVRQLLTEAGFIGVWLKPVDFDVARLAFIEREARKPASERWPHEMFDIQVGRIETFWDEIEPLFAPRIVTTLDEEGNRMAPAEILRCITTKT